MIEVFVPKNSQDAMLAVRKLAEHLDGTAQAFGIRAFTLSIVVDNPPGSISPIMGTFSCTMHNGKIVSARKNVGGIVDTEEYRKLESKEE